MAQQPESPWSSRWVLGQPKEMQAWDSEGKYEYTYIYSVWRFKQNSRSLGAQEIHASFWTLQWKPDKPETSGVL